MNTTNDAVLQERLRLAERHMAALLVALDAVHTSHGCACPHGHCVLSETWVPAAVRRPAETVTGAKGWTVADADWRDYEILKIDSPQAAAFAAGVARNGGSRERCPLCDGQRLHLEPDRRHGFVGDPPQQGLHPGVVVACHDCRVRWSAVNDPTEDSDTTDRRRHRVTPRATRPGSGQ